MAYLGLLMSIASILKKPKVTWN